MIRLLLLLFLVSLVPVACHIKMTNDPPPPPLQWYSFPVHTLQLKDALDSIVAMQSNLFYHPYRHPGSPYFSVFYTPAPGDTVEYFLAFSATLKRWIEKPDSSHLALADIYPGRLPSDSLSSIIGGKEFTVEEKEFFKQVFKEKLINPLLQLISISEPYTVRPLTIKDTLEAPWLICKGKQPGQCDTLWLTRKDASQWVLVDSSFSRRQH
jgi:hypothetical protein